MERYEAYKDSGIEWIGEIPASWRMLRIQQCFTEECRVNDRLESFHALKFFAGTIVPKPEKWDAEEVADTYARYRCVSPGTIMINNLNLNFDLKSLRVGLVEEEGIITSAYVAIVPGVGIDPRFANYVLKSWDYRKAFHNMGKGLRLTLDWHELSKHRIQVPNLYEQQAIADYLDARTAEIDSLVADCEREVGLLREYRKAVISEAVTKGLDPDAPMKDSGVEWIGEIPEGWEPNTISGVTSMITNGYVGPTRDLFVDEGVRYLQSLHIVNGVIDFEKHPYYVTGEWSAIHSRSILKEGDVLVVQTGAIGNCAFVDESYEGCNCHALIVLRPNESQMSGRFLYYYLSSDIGREKMLLTRTGATHPHLNSTKIKFTHVVVPPLVEQRRLIQYLDAKTAEIDSLIESKQQMAGKLREYRKSLISEAVTGKFKVSGVK